MPKFNPYSFFPAAASGATLGAMIGACGALLTGNSVIRTASITATGIGLLTAAQNFSGIANPELKQPSFAGIAREVAKDEMAAAAVGFAVYKSLKETDEFYSLFTALFSSLLAAYPVVTVGLSFLKEYVKSNASTIERSGSTSYVRRI